MWLLYYSVHMGQLFQICYWYVRWSNGIVDSIHASALYTMMQQHMYATTGHARHATVTVTVTILITVPLASGQEANTNAET